jgi:hypothetical protein
MPAKRTIVFPATDGSYLMGVPHAPIIADAATAARLVKTGAFTAEGKSDVDPVELSEDALNSLDRVYDPVEQPPPEEAPATEGPAETGGSSDSKPEE